MQPAPDRSLANREHARSVVRADERILLERSADEDAVVDPLVLTDRTSARRWQERQQLGSEGDRGRHGPAFAGRCRGNAEEPGWLPSVVTGGSAEPGPSDQLESGGRGHRLDEQQRGQDQKLHGCGLDRCGAA